MAKISPDLAHMIAKRMDGNYYDDFSNFLRYDIFWGKKCQKQRFFTIFLRFSPKNAISQKVVK